VSSGSHIDSVPPMTVESSRGESGLAFERLGDGPPLMLLHGTNSSREVWKPLLAKLCAEREVIALDLPAHGRHGRERSPR
jgi:pimeloyl-ACP methyl ester carboxylesterase